MRGCHDVGPGQRQYVAIALERQVVTAETITPEVALRQIEGLLHGARRAVEDQEAFGKGAGERRVCCTGVRHGYSKMQSYTQPRRSG